jgi:DNA-binding response OmpR family regulator
MEHVAHPQAIRVWIVDDDADLLSMLDDRMKSCGWDTSMFTNGLDFEAALQSASPHVLILDRQLPHQSGTHLLTALRSKGYRFPVIILSAQGTSHNRVEGLEVGANDYMAKPFLWRELELRLRQLIAQQLTIKPELPATELFRLNDVLFNPIKLEIVGPQGNKADISRADGALLTFFCRSPGITFERDQLLQASGSIVEAASSRSLDMRISKLRRSLNTCAKGSGRMIESVRGRGYKLNAIVQLEAINQTNAAVSSSPI